MMTCLLRTPSRFTRPPPSLETIFDGIFSQDESRPDMRDRCASASDRIIGISTIVSAACPSRKKILYCASSFVSSESVAFCFTRTTYCSAFCMPSFSLSLELCFTRCLFLFFSYSIYTIVLLLLKCYRKTVFCLQYDGI